MGDTASEPPRRTRQRRQGTRRPKGSPMLGPAAATRAGSDRDVRERLLVAALDLFNRKGYAATTVREIVAAAGVTKPVLYYHFGNKEGLFRAMLGDVLARFESNLAALERAPGSARLRIARLLTGLYDLFRDHIPIARLIHAVFYGPSEGAPHFDFEAFPNIFFAALRRLVAEGVARGEFRGGHSVDDMALVFQGVTAMCMDAELANAPVRPGREGLLRMLDILFEGMQGASGDTRE